LSVEARLRKVGERIWLPISGFLAEAFVFTPVPVLRPLVRMLLASQLRDLDRVFDADFYLRQVQAGSSRRRVACDPALHYLLLGRYRNFAVNADFDPIFYRAYNADLKWAEDPVAHYLQNGLRGTPINGVPNNEPTNEVSTLPPPGGRAVLFRGKPNRIDPSPQPGWREQPVSSPLRRAFGRYGTPSIPACAGVAGLAAVSGL
jgi:hypothetical protein